MSEFNEPWQALDIDQGRLALADNKGECLEYNPFDGIRSLQHLHRIVACVNACAGIPTDQLTEVIKYGREIMEL